MFKVKRDNRWCLICQPRNRTIYVHKNPDDAPKNPGKTWLYCNKCHRGYSLEQYCDITGIEMVDFLSGEIHYEEAKPDEVNAISWPHNFVPLSDPRATKGVEYVKGRGLSLDGDMYYDLDQEGIVFPLYFENYFCGAQVRFITPRVDEDGKQHKMTTVQGTRVGQLIYGWNQNKLMPHIKRVVVTEGAFNCISLQQTFNEVYGGVSNHPWKFIATSGSSISAHQIEVLKGLKDKGYKVVAAPDLDEAGFSMFKKLNEAEAVSHYAFTGDTEKDWNDMAKTMSKKEFASWFLKQVQVVS